MRIQILWLALILVSACAKESSSHDSKKPSAPPVVVTPVNPPVEEEEETELPPIEYDEQDFAEIPKLLPTMYYVAQEKETSCRGRYGSSGPTYNGSETTPVIGLNGQTLATVCTRFYRVLLMEGTAILKDRGLGEITLNYGGKVNGVVRFYVPERCTFGEGVRRDLCLLPHHTIAADNRVHKVGDIIFIPKVVGLLLPDGTPHEGFFIVRDTGAAFNGIGSQRVDLFTGTEPDNDNMFSRAGFHHRKEMQAFKVKGPSAEAIKERLRLRFGDLY